MSEESAPRYSLNASRWLIDWPNGFDADVRAVGGLQHEGGAHRQRYGADPLRGHPVLLHPVPHLTAPERFLDSQPRSRNEALASLMRRFDICEERGSGIDKVVAEVERFPAASRKAPTVCARTSNRCMCSCECTMAG